GEKDPERETAGSSRRHRHDPEHPRRVRLLRREMQKHLQLHRALSVLASFLGLGPGHDCPVLCPCSLPHYGLG
ncbi:hypothetical protein AVEN_205112-1, partial [Araneus ventricosus]